MNLGDGKARGLAVTRRFVEWDFYPTGTVCREDFWAICFSAEHTTRF